MSVRLWSFQKLYLQLRILNNRLGLIICHLLEIESGKSPHTPLRPVMRRKIGVYYYYEDTNILSHSRGGGFKQ